MQLFIKDIGEIVCSDSNCIIVEIFFVIDTREKLKNGRTTDQSLQKGTYDKKIVHVDEGYESYFHEDPYFVTNLLS